MLANRSPQTLQNKNPKPALRIFRGNFDISYFHSNALDADKLLRNYVSFHFEA